MQLELCNPAQRFESKKFQQTVPVLLGNFLKKHSFTLEWEKRSGKVSAKKNDNPGFRVFKIFKKSSPDEIFHKLFRFLSPEQSWRRRLNFASPFHHRRSNGPGKRNIISFGTFQSMIPNVFEISVKNNIY